MYHSRKRGTKNIDDMLKFHLPEKEKDKYHAENQKPESGKGNDRPALGISHYLFLLIAAVAEKCTERTDKRNIKYRREQCPDDDFRKVEAYPCRTARENCPAKIFHLSLPFSLLTWT